MRLLNDATAAAWLVVDAVEAPHPFDVLTLGPQGYDAYATVDLVTPLPGAAEPLDDIDQARIAVDTLSRFTSTPDLYYFCVWTGYQGSFLPDELVAEAVAHLPYRDYVLFAGDRSDLDYWGEDFDTKGFQPPPAFMWPADRAWCFTKDVDREWAGIAAGEPAIDTLLQRNDLVIAWTTYPG